MFDAIKFWITTEWSKLPRDTKRSAIAAGIVSFLVGFLWAFL